LGTKHTMNTVSIEKSFGHFRWIDLSNPNKTQLKSFGELYHLDLILLNDSIQHGHLPKWEKSGNFSFVILRSYTAAAGDPVTKYGELSNKIAFFINEELIITIHRKEFSFLKGIHGDFHHPHELFLEIASQMVDSFEAPIRVQSEKIDQFERTLFLKRGSNLSLEELYFLKSRARNGRKLLVLTQSVLNQIVIRAEYQSKLQDIKDNLTQSILLYEEIQDDAINLLSTYLSISAQRNNDVMRLLTIFSVFFLPLTFVAGIYGMNFENMPELKWVSGYYMILGVMAVICVIIYFWFKRKKII